MGRRDAGAPRQTFLPTLQPRVLTALCMREELPYRPFIAFGGLMRAKRAISFQYMQAAHRIVNGIRRLSPHSGART